MTHQTRHDCREPLTSLHGFVCVPHTDISLLYLVVDSIHTAVGRFRLLIRPSGIRCRASWEIQRVVLTVLNSFSRQSFLVSTNVTSALEVFLNDMCYINSRLLTYLLTNQTRVWDLWTEPSARLASHHHERVGFAVRKESNTWATHLLTDLTLWVADRWRPRFSQIPFCLQL